MGLVKKLGVGVAVVACLLPLLISQLIGGWVTKYTSSVDYLATIKQSQAGKTIIVTGANNGVGYESALELARNGAHVVMGCRSETKGQAAAAEITAEIASTSGAGDVEYMQLDLASFASIEGFAASFTATNNNLDVLMLNAGIMKSPGVLFVGQEFNYGFALTEDGFESHIGINHVGHFHLLQLLTATLKASAPSRVIIVSSAAENGAPPGGVVYESWRPTSQPADYEDGAAYGQSKLSNLLTAKEAAVRFKGSGVTAYSLHPGVIATNLAADMTAHMAERPESKMAKVVGAMFLGFFNTALFNRADGALNQLYLATADVADLENGAFYHPIGKVVAPEHVNGVDADLQKELWVQTEAMIASVKSK